MHAMLLMSYSLRAKMNEISYCDIMIAVLNSVKNYIRFEICKRLLH